MLTSKIHICCEPSLIKELDKITGERERSKFIVEAINEKIAKVKMKNIVTECAGAWKIENHKNFRTIEDVVKEINEYRKDSDSRIKELYNE
jgi:metal-responsive CopG/Arc/MetJ family transcriptional regulator